MSVDHCPKSYVFLLGVPLRVGLSAISLLAFVFSSLKKIRCLLTVVCCLKMLAKDAAPIPNALEAIKTKISENFK